MDNDDSLPNYATVNGYGPTEMLAHVQRLIREKLGPEYVDQLSRLFSEQLVPGEDFLGDNPVMDFNCWVSIRYPLGFASVLDRERTRLRNQRSMTKAQQFHIS
jgi:hypothetical protein